MVIVAPHTEEKMSVEVARQPEEIPSSDQNPPPYSPLPRGEAGEGSSLQVATFQSPPPNLSATNYLHVIEKNDTLKQNVLLDLSLPPPHASTLLTGTQDSEVSNLILDSHNGTVSIEVWVHRSDHGNTAPRDNKGMRERARLEFRTHNGIIKALVHIHPSMTEPRPLLQIEARGHNGSVAISIPRSFRGQLKLHTHNGRVTLSSALASRAAMLSGVNGAHTYFVGERPGDDKWRTGTGGEGEEVDEAIGWSKNGSIKVSYDDEDGARTPGVLSNLFRAMGF